ncbi:MAG TPA: hypothetical protein PLK34_03335 [Candidatus Pacearchaeota archaeon]|nr:hypothetical protein [Candidatus Pacearchaeota archaeon]
MVNKKGMSEIVTTLIMVLLGIVIVGVIWAVVNGFVKNSTSQVELSQKCSNSELEVTYVDCNDAVGVKTCVVTVKRVKGTDTLGGVKISLKNSVGQAVTSDLSGDIAIASTKTPASPIAYGAAPNAINGPITEVEAMIYFNDAGTTQYCTSNTVKTNSIL